MYAKNNLKRPKLAGNSVFEEKVLIRSDEIDDCCLKLLHMRKSECFSPIYIFVCKDNLLTLYLEIFFSSYSISITLENEPTLVQADKENEA
jgi:hypothetical protein